MDKLIRDIEKELKEIEEQGITANNLEVTSKLVDMLKDLTEVEKMKQGGRSMREYRDGGYSDYRDGGGYGGRYEEGNYGRRGVPGSGRGGYRGEDGRMSDHINRIMEGAEQYEYGRERYRHGDNEERMQDGLEKLMYAICLFVESTMEFAESPREKEIIRKHIQKLKNM